MFINPSLRLNNAISNVLLDTSNNELYENGIRVATQTDIDFLQQEINSFIPDNPNGWINSDGITSTSNRIPFTDGSPNGMTTNQNLTFAIDPQNNPTLTVGGTQMISVNNNMYLRSAGEIETGNDLILKGPADVQRSLQLGTNNNSNYVKTYVDKDTFDFITDNQIGTASEYRGSSSYIFDNNIISNQNVILNQGKSLTLNNDTDVNNVKLYKVNGANGTFFIDNQSGTKTQFKNASEYYFDNDVKIGDNTTTKKLYLNDVEITPSSGVGVSAGMLRALNLNLLVPTVTQTYDVVWSNLTAQQQLEWKGLDPTTSDPVQSATGNYWSFVKSAPSANKINWTLPIDLGNITFEDLQSVWAIVRINNNTTINAEGQLWFQIQTSPATGPNFYRTRWNYSNSATPMNQFQYFYKIHALDTITTTNAQNLGKGQEVGQTKFKGNPCDVEPNLWSIGFNKLVGSPTGDTTTPGYTRGPILSVALNTASNIHTYNFDVVAIGVNNIRYNLFFA